EGQHQDLDIRAAFAKTTDGPHCPISRVYRPEEFCELCATAGFKATFIGSAISMWELSLLPLRFEAVLFPAFKAEHREFLMELTYDNRGIPNYRGHCAGVDGCFELTPK